MTENALQSVDTSNFELTQSILHGKKEPQQIVFTRGSGCRLWDVDGKEYLDLVSGTMGVAMIGHSHPAVIDAVTRQMGLLASNLYFFDSDAMVRFSERMSQLAPMGPSKTLLCPGGGEGVEAAVKLAIRVTGKTEVVSLTGAYHGQSLATMSLGGMPQLRSWVPGAARWPTFRQVASPHDYQKGAGMVDEAATQAAIIALEAAIDRAGYDQVAAFILEIVQGPGGHIMFPEAYYREVQRVCRERDVLVIVDEVQTGLGRCGSLWACDLVGLEPDMITIGKAFGGGVPFGGVIARESLVTDEVELQGWHYLTFMNQPLQAAAGLAVVDVVEREGLVERASVLGRAARTYLEDCCARYETLTRVNGPGLFLAVELTDGGDDSTAADACHEAYYWGLREGIITYTGGGGNILKFKPALTSTDSELDEMLERFEQILARADAGIREASAVA